MCSRSINYAGVGAILNRGDVLNSSRDKIYRCMRSFDIVNDAVDVGVFKAYNEVLQLTEKLINRSIAMKKY